MKFLYADSLDFVDPKYDFIEDRSASSRQPYWDDAFPHEFFGKAPFDGFLISRGIVGDHKFPGKYTQAQAMRFRRVGARKFLRIDKPEFKDLEIFGDCGAFSYANHDLPPYTTSEILEFYEDGGFSHGCSVDHVIFDFERNLKGMEALKDQAASAKAKERFDITIENAAAFYKECKDISHPFTPLGVVQGWSPGSMAEAARRLVAMGYDYLALGGMVPLNTESIKQVLSAVRELVPDYVRLHILGFGKIDEIDEIMEFGVTSFDTTSPLLRAFKDNKRNFFMTSDDKKLRYYTAVRIPQVSENRSLGNLVKKGHFTEKFLLDQERDALNAVRKLDAGKASVEDALTAVLAYTRSHLTNPTTGKPPSEEAMATTEADYRKILTDKPWQVCPCEVCRTASVEVAIFRASNRNKRRGFHNMWAFNSQLKRLIGKDIVDGKRDKIQGRQS